MTVKVEDKDGGETSKTITVNVSKFALYFPIALLTENTKPPQKRIA